MMNTVKSEIELALDLRSYESLAVFGDGDYDNLLREGWFHIQDPDDVQSIGLETPVLIDRIDPTPKMLEMVSRRGPRIAAFIPANVEQEKSIRRLLLAMYPWAEVWTISTAIGKALVTNGLNGLPYDRELVRDERPADYA